MRIVLVGEEIAAVQALRLLTAGEHEVAAVLTESVQRRAGTVANLAHELGLPIMAPRLVREDDFAGWMTERDVDLLVNVHSLQIAGGAVVEAPRVGSFNLHPGPLPQYAGLNAPSWAIYEGESRHAVTLHWMTAEVDAGAIAYEAWFDIAPTDTGLRLSARCIRNGIPLIRQLLHHAELGAEHIPHIPQATTGGRWFGAAPPHEGRLPWDMPARRVVDLVRAADYAPFHSPWGWPRSRVGGVDVEIVRVSATGEATSDPPGTVGEARGAGVLVASADEWVLVEGFR